MSTVAVELKDRAMNSLRVAAIDISPLAKHGWTTSEVTALFDLPFNDLAFAAQWVHRHWFDPNSVQVSTLLSIKTGACPEDCAYCPQSIRYDTGIENHDLLSLDAVTEAARAAKAAGATRFCIGAAYRGPKPQQLERIGEMIRAVKDIGLETCATLGLLKEGQAETLAAAGLDYYNHNLDSSRAFYPSIISTRSYDDRLATLGRVRAAGLKVCCGGILGMGESRSDRIALLRELATLPAHPESVPINKLIPIPGTPLEDAPAVDGLEFARTIAVARILMPESYIRLSAGRTAFSDELQALCFAVGANSIFYGEKLLTAENPDCVADRALFARLGLKAEGPDDRAGA
jgi:biotin synthase